MKRISVAMAVYNGARYLTEQLDSIVSQLESDDELVISYDNSTDNSWALLEEYAQKDTRIKLLKNPNPGLIGNFQNALSHCSGDYVFISDQDDRWAPNKREMMVSAFEKTKADMILHNAVHTDCQGNIISKPFFQLFGIRPGDSALRIFVRPRYSGCTMAFTQRFLGLYLPFPEKIDGYDTWIAILSKLYGKVAYVDACLLYHRLHGDNVTPKSPRPLWVKIKSRIYMARHLAKRSFGRPRL